MKETVFLRSQIFVSAGVLHRHIDKPHNVWLHCDTRTASDNASLVSNYDYNYYYIY